LKDAHDHHARTGHRPAAGCRRKAQTFKLDEPGGGRLRATPDQRRVPPNRALDLHILDRVCPVGLCEGKTLPVNFGFTTAPNASEPGPLVRDETGESDAQFEARGGLVLWRCPAATLVQAAARVSWPLVVNRRRRTTIRNRAALARALEVLFTPAAIAALQGAIPHEMFVRDGMAMIAGGAVGGSACAWREDAKLCRVSKHSAGCGAEDTRQAAFTKLSITRFRSPPSKSISSLLPSCAATTP